MKIALLGYGKMGKAIEAEATKRGHEVVLTIDNGDDWEQKGDLMKNCDIAIDFSMPSTAVENIYRCFAIGLPVVVGTTGWYDQIDQVVADCRKQDQSLFVASNFSIGMNIVFAMNRRLAELMGRRDEYRVSITETHHIHKLDAPSGTAITLANDIAGRSKRYGKWVLANTTEPDEGDIPVTSVREGEVPGIHEIVYDSEMDTIRLSHSAKSRKGLAVGAVLAAEFLLGKKGYYTMDNLIAQL